MILERQPNAVPGLPISCDWINRWRDSLEEFARFGWRPGLVQVPDGARPLSVAMEPQDVIHLRRLHAFGARGWPFLVDDRHPDTCVTPFDATRLGVGRHDLFICLHREKCPTGEAAEFLTPTTGELHRYQPDLRPVLVLAVGQERTQHRDWFQVAVIHRTVSDGSIRTQLDPGFHPPIHDMAAYLHTNPIPPLVEDFLRRLDGTEFSEMHKILRANLMNLAAIAECGDPQTVFMKVHLCLSLAREFLDDYPLKNANMECFRYSPETFCRFLQMLEQVPDSLSSVYPDVLILDGDRFLRADGHFAADGDFWVWYPEAKNFVARAIALYMPYALSEVPFISYGHHREEASRWPLAKPVKQIAQPGSAVMLTEIKAPTDAVQLRTSTLGENQNLRLKLGEGHAVYYQ